MFDVDMCMYMELGGGFDDGELGGGVGEGIAALSMKGRKDRLDGRELEIGK